MKELFKEIIRKLSRFMYNERLNMSKEAAEARIKQLESAIEQSKTEIEQRNANHHALFGALAEARNMLKICFDEVEKTAEETKEVVGEVV